MYREKMFDTKFRKIVVQDDKFIIFEEELPPFDGVKSLLFPFPHWVVETEEDRKVLLAFLSSFDSVAWMQPLSDIFLGGKSPSLFTLISSFPSAVSYT